MSGNVHPNPGPIFPSCVRWKCDLVGQVSAMLQLFQMGPSKVLTTFPLQIQSSWSCLHVVSPLGPFDTYTSTVQSNPSSANAALPPHPRLQTSYSRSAHFVSSPSAPLPLSLGCPFSPHCCVPTRNNVTLSLDSSEIYTSTVQSSPSSTNAELPPHPRLQTSYPRSAHSVSSPSSPLPSSLAPGCPSTPPVSSPPLTLSGFSNGMLEVFESEALNYFTFSCPTLSTLSASRNPILTHLPCSTFLVSLLRVLIAPIIVLALSPEATHVSGDVIILVRRG